MIQLRLCGLYLTVLFGMSILGYSISKFKINVRYLLVPVKILIQLYCEVFNVTNS